MKGQAELLTLRPSLLPQWSQRWGGRLKLLQCVRAPSASTPELPYRSHIHLHHQASRQVANPGRPDRPAEQNAC